MSPITYKIRKYNTNKTISKLLYFSFIAQGTKQFSLLLHFNQGTLNLRPEGRVSNSHWRGCFMQSNIVLALWRTCWWYDSCERGPSVLLFSMHVLPPLPATVSCVAWYASTYSRKASLHLSTMRVDGSVQRGSGVSCERSYTFFFPPHKRRRWIRMPCAACHGKSQRLNSELTAALAFPADDICLSTLGFAEKGEKKRNGFTVII